LCLLHLTQLSKRADFDRHAEKFALEALEIAWVRLRDEIEILGSADEAVSAHRHPADDDEVKARARESSSMRPVSISPAMRQV